MLLLLPLAVSPASADAPTEPTYMVSDLSGRGLLPQEQAQVREILAAALEARGLSVVDPAFTTTVIEHGRSGRHAETGAPCGRPLMPTLAEEQWWDLLGADRRIEAALFCNDQHDCTLSVRSYDGPGFGGRTDEHWTAPWNDHVPWPEALADAAAQLAPYNEQATGGLGIGGMMGGAGGKRVVEVKPERFSYRTWRSRGILRAGEQGPRVDLPGGDDALRACFDIDQPGGEVALLLDAQGTIEACGGRDAETPAVVCACDLLTDGGRVLEPVEGGRLHMGISLQPASTLTRGGDVVRVRVEAVRKQGEDGLYHPVVSDPSVARWAPPTGHRLAGCFTDHGKRPATVRATVRFDAEGAATGAALGGQQGLSKAEQRCVEAALQHSRASCPAAPDTTAEVSIDLTVETPTAQ